MSVCVVYSNARCVLVYRLPLKVSTILDVYFHKWEHVKLSSNDRNQISQTRYVTNTQRIVVPISGLPKHILLSTYTQRNNQQIYSKSSLINIDQCYVGFFDITQGIILNV